jgi:hypothetical protein
MFDCVIPGSDPLYSRLTAKQECFLARLTPKPLRCGCKRPSSLYPWDTPDQERAYRCWQAKYEAKACAGFPPKPNPGQTVLEKQRSVL